MKPLVYTVNCGRILETHHLGSCDPVLSEGRLVGDIPVGLDHDVEVDYDGAAQGKGVAKPDVPRQSLKTLQKFNYNTFELFCCDFSIVLYWANLPLVPPDLC